MRSSITELRLGHHGGLAIACLAAWLIASNYANIAVADQQQQESNSNQADAKSTSVSDEHADDEAPQLGVIVGSCPGEGVCVLGTVWGSPADDAGIVHGDYILSLNGTTVSTPKELIAALKQAKEGDKAKVKLWRQGETIEREVMLASKADEPPASHRAWLGVMLTPAENDEGVQIDQVMRGSPAEKADLRIGDVIVKRDDQAIGDIRSFAENIEDMQPGSELQLTVKREGNPMQIKVTVGDIEEAPMRFWRQAQDAMQSIGGQSTDRSATDESSSMLEDALDEMRQRVRELERKLGELKTSDEVSQRSDVSGSDGTMLVVQRGQRRGSDWSGSDWSGSDWNRGRSWDHNYNDWQNRYRSGYRYPLYQSPRYGNSYYRYGGRPYYGNFGRNYGFGRGGVRIGNLGVWW